MAPRIARPAGAPQPRCKPPVKATEHPANPKAVIPGLDPGIRCRRRMDGRVKPGHDERRDGRVRSDAAVKTIGAARCGSR